MKTALYVAVALLALAVMSASRTSVVPEDASGIASTGQRPAAPATVGLDPPVEPG